MPADSRLSVVRSAFEAWSERDFAGTLRHIDPNIRWHPGGFPPGSAEVYEGHDGVKRFWDEFIEPWEEVSIELEEIMERERDQILARVRFFARGRQEMEIDARAVHLYRFEGDLIREFHGFGERRPESLAEARRMAGLE